jgi:hypothetical protein
LTKSPGLDDAIGRPVVRDRAVGAGGDDRLERRTVTALVAHQVLELERDLPLAASGADPGQQRVEGAIADRTRLAQQGDLLLVLDRPQPLDQPAGERAAPRPRPPWSASVLLDRHLVRLEADPRDAALRRPLGQRRTDALGDQPLDVRRLRRRLGDVAAVGREDRVVGGDQQGALDPVKPHR